MKNFFQSISAPEFDEVRVYLWILSTIIFLHDLFFSFTTFVQTSTFGLMLILGR